MFSKLIGFGSAGFGGAFLYNNPDAIEGITSGSTFSPSSILHYLTAPSSKSSSKDSSSVTNKAQLEAMDSLKRELSDLKHMQRSGYNTLVYATQPTTFLGFPIWKIFAITFAVGSIYWKVKGYEIKDLVYVSKKHFNTVTENLRLQFDVLKEVMDSVKADLMERVQILETKLVDAREAIEAKIGYEMTKVDGKIEGVSSELVKVNGQLSQSGIQISSIATDIGEVKKDISGINSGIDSRLTKVHNEVEDLRAASDENYARMSAKTTNIDNKIEKLSLQTTQHLSALQAGLDQSSKGIKLLCEFVAQSQPTVTGTKSDLLESLQEYARSSQGPQSPLSLQSKNPMLPPFFRNSSSPSLTPKPSPRTSGP
eukprot:c13297_g1_i2.p1 GENE.c13297_g1_i2~~c13297_g1_i2.p1  ORF type:complete len:368 (-),score=157.77 c13297_g1_i2:115-1218(-)